MDIALDDIKYKNYLIKIQELEKKLNTTYSNLKIKNNDYLKELLEKYEKYLILNEEIKKKKREALENILEHIESLNVDDKKDLKIVSTELKKLF